MKNILETSGLSFSIYLPRDIAIAVSRKVEKENIQLSKIVQELLRKWASK